MTSHVIRMLLSVLLLTIFSSLGQDVKGKEKIIVSTEVWEPGYTIDGGLGLYEEIVLDVFSDYTVEFVYEDYMRTKALVKSEVADFWIGAYLDEERYAYYPAVPIDFDEIISLRLKKNTPDGEPRNSTDAKMVWLKGYKYDHYFPPMKLQGYEVRDIATAIKLLEHNKADFILGDETELYEKIPKTGYDLDHFEARFFGLLGLYPGFAKTKKSHRLIEIWNTKMNILLKNGELKALYKKHGFGHKYLFGKDREPIKQIRDEGR